MSSKKPSGKRKIGLREVAEATNVSIATVSRVLSGSDRVDPAVQKAVLHAAARLGVDGPHRNKLKTLVFVLSNSRAQHPFQSRVLLGAEGSCADHLWELNFLSFEYAAATPSSELRLPNALLRRDLVRGVILAGLNHANLLQLLEQKGIPYVVQGNNVSGDLQQLHSDLVFSDDTGGAREITRYLIDLGHQRIGFLADLRRPWFARCFAGYSAAMQAANLETVLSNIDADQPSDVGYLGTKSLLSSARRPTAIFAGDDEVAYGVYKALRDMSLRIPEDISVVGCDDTIGRWLQPGLTTIKQFPEQIGRKMFETILCRIELPGKSPSQVTIPTELIRRESCRLLSSSSVSDAKRKRRDA